MAQTTWIHARMCILQQKSLLFIPPISNGVCVWRYAHIVQFRQVVLATQKEEEDLEDP